MRPVLIILIIHILEMHHLILSETYCKKSSILSGHHFLFWQYSPWQCLRLLIHRGRLFNIGYINECTSGSCSVVRGSLRESCSHGMLSGKNSLERNIAEESGFENSWVGCGSGRFWGIWLEGRRDEVVVRPHPMVSPLSPSYPTSPPCFLVFIWIFDDQYETHHLLSETHCKGQYFVWTSARGCCHSVFCST